MAQTLRPVSDVLKGNWIPVPSFINTLWDKIDEQGADSDTTYIRISDFSSPTCEVNLSSANTPIAGTRTLRFYARVSIGSGAIGVRLKEGGTLIQQTAVTLTNSYTGYTLNITEPITDYSDLTVEIKASSKGGQIRVTQVEFVIPNAATVPTVTTQAVTSITTTTATGNGNVTSDGGQTITERGVCYNTTPLPTISDSTSTSGGTTGAFTASMTSLTPGTTYYVRAYAINSIGVSYGGNVSFSTEDIITQKVYLIT